MSPTAPRLLVCALSLYALAPFLRLLGLLRPEYARPWSPSRRSGPPDVPGAALLAGVRQLHVTPLACAQGLPFAPEQEAILPAQAGQAGQACAVSVCVDRVGAYSPGIFDRFDQVILLLQDVREMQWHLTAMHGWLTTGRLPDGEAMAREIRDGGATARQYWNEHTLGFLSPGILSRVHVFRMEELAASFAIQARRLEALTQGMLTQGMLPQGLDFPGLLRATGLPDSLFQPQGEGERRIDAALEARALQDCGPVLELCGYDASPGSGRILAPPAPLARKDMVVDLLRDGSLTPRAANQTLCLLHPEDARTVVEIPARSGSKRLPHKNVADVNGLPLLALTIRFALGLPGVDLVLVNTDDERYAALARQHGASTPFLRPKALAQDASPLDQAADYAVRRLLLDAGMHVGRHVVMYPTTPFRSRETVVEMLEGLRRHSHVTACMEVAPAWDELRLGTTDGFLPLADFLLDAPPADPLCKTSGYFVGQSCLSPEQGHLFVALRHPFEYIDVDCEQDLELVRQVAALEGLTP